MNAEQANDIPMPDIMDALNFLPVRNSNSLDMWYYSPFRKEKTPSFHINAVKNRWYDFGEAIGGTPIDFVCTWLERTNESHSVSDALRWLTNMMLQPSPLLVLPQEEHVEETKTLILKKVTAVKNPALIAYLDSRGIPLGLASAHLKQVCLNNAKTGNDFYALGIRNEENGYELRNKFFKGCYGTKHISFIRGTKTSQGDIHVFEGFMDYLSALVYERNNRFTGDAIILNSLSCFSKAIPYIETCPYETLHTWLDNDKAGETVTTAFNEFAIKQKLSFSPMNLTYAPHKDVNAWHMNKIGL